MGNECTKMVTVNEQPYPPNQPAQQQNFNNFSTNVGDSIPVPLLVHMANVGDRQFHGGFAGSRGESRAIEGIQVTGLSVSNVWIELQAHIAHQGDSQWVPQGQMAHKTRP